MYRGEISISQEDLGPLIETAKCLQIKGLAMAQTNVNIPTPSPTNSKKRSLSQLSPTLETSPSSSTCSNQQNKTKKSKIKHISCIEEPVVSSQELIEPIKGEISEEKEETIGENKEYISELQETIFNQKTLSLSSPLTANVTLPVLPKPLSILKTAETRTYLSKLIWLGNGGRRPQYGNPDTKPSWWPQHILPWEEMKKMGGRKSVELSHINYTEVLKQCLAAGYEYFGYDPATYYSSDHDSSLSQENSYVIDGNPIIAEDDAISTDGDRSEQPLEIDLDHVAGVTGVSRVSAEEKSMRMRRNSDQKQILCK